VHSIRSLIFILLTSFLFAACGGGGAESVATLAPTAVTGAGASDAAADQSPRADDTGLSSSIPPTWTPGPSAEEIPAQQRAFPTRRPDETYVVQPGDTLAEIAEQFGVDLQRLASTNDIVNIDFIFTGQVLTIPR
jgi:nucleoid-associated protein YgaU